MIKRRWILWTGSIAVIGAGLWAYLYFESVPQVTVAHPTRGPAIKAVYATGNVEATHWAKVTPLVRGRIIEICNCEGKQVSRGDILAKQDDREMRALLGELKAREAFLADDLKRYGRLLDRKVISAQAYEKIASKRSEVLSAIAAAYERMSQRVLRAPMDGIVLRRDGEVGEVVQSSDILFWVGKPKPLRITAEVDEEDIPLVSIGQRALIKADAFPGQPLAGTVDQITPKGDPINKNYRVRIGLPDDTPLRMGMTTEINIVVQQVKETVLVPSAAVVEGKIWIVKDGRAEPRKVETGIVGGEKTQIKSGIATEDLIVVEPPAGLAKGGRVRIVAAKRAAK